MAHTHLQNESKYKIEHNDGVFELKSIDLMPQNRRNSKIMLFFHGNAEDIGIARRTLNMLK